MDDRGMDGPKVAERSEKRCAVERGAQSVGIAQIALRGDRALGQIRRHLPRQGAHTGATRD
jgi:hypothetical protein